MKDAPRHSLPQLFAGWPKQTAGLRLTIPFAFDDASNGNPSDARVRYVVKLLGRAEFQAMDAAMALTDWSNWIGTVDEGRPPRTA